MKSASLVLAIVLLAPCGARAQGARLQLDALDKLAARAADSVNISIDASMLQLASTVIKDKGNEAEVKALLSGLKGIYVRSFEFDDDQTFTEELETIRKQLAAKEWVRMVDVDSKRDREVVQIYSFREGDVSTGMVIVVAEPRELTVVNIVGPIDISKLGALSGLGIPPIKITP